MKPPENKSVLQLHNPEMLSIVKIHGKPILPPVMDDDRIEEMKNWRAKAVALEKGKVPNGVHTPVGKVDMATMTSLNGLDEESSEEENSVASAIRRNSGFVWAGFAPSGVVEDVVANGHDPEELVGKNQANGLPNGHQVSPKEEDPFLAALARKYADPQDSDQPVSPTEERHRGGSSTSGMTTPTAGPVRFLDPKLLTDSVNTAMGISPPRRSFPTSAVVSVDESTVSAPSSAVTSPIGRHLQRHNLVDSMDAAMGIDRSMPMQGRRKVSPIVAAPGVCHFNSARFDHVASILGDTEAGCLASESKEVREMERPVVRAHERPLASLSPEEREELSLATVKHHGLVDSVGELFSPEIQQVEEEEEPMSLTTLATSTGVTLDHSVPIIKGYLDNFHLSRPNEFSEEETKSEEPIPERYLTFNQPAADTTQAVDMEQLEQQHQKQLEELLEKQRLEKERLMAEFKASTGVSKVPGNRSSFASTLDGLTMEESPTPVPPEPVSFIYLPEQALAMKGVWTKVSALVKGYLTRRLARVDKVQRLKKEILETAQYLVKLGDSPDVTKHRSEMVCSLKQQLMKYNKIFLDTSTKEQLAVIAQDRVAKHEKLLRQSSSTTSIRSGRQSGRPPVVRSASRKFLKK